MMMYAGPRPSVELGRPCGEPLDNRSRKGEVLLAFLGRVLKLVFGTPCDLVCFRDATAVGGRCCSSGPDGAALTVAMVETLPEVDVEQCRRVYVKSIWSWPSATSVWRMPSAILT